MRCFFFFWKRQIIISFGFLKVGKTNVHLELPLERYRSTSSPPPIPCGSVNVQVMPKEVWTTVYDSNTAWFGASAHRGIDSGVLPVHGLVFAEVQTITWKSSPPPQTANYQNHHSQQPPQESFSPPHPQQNHHHHHKQQQTTTTTTAATTGSKLYSLNELRRNEKGPLSARPILEVLQTQHEGNLRACGLSLPRRQGLPF